MDVESFAIVDRRDLSPLVDKLASHGASAVFTIVRGILHADVRMPANPQETALCRQIVEDWNAGLYEG
jgi:hypothetical protein